MSNQVEVHIEKRLDPETFDSIADFICGDLAIKFPTYRSSSSLTRFFNNLGMNVIHDGSTRKWWVLDILKSLSKQELEAVILRLVDLKEYKGDRNLFLKAYKAMNDILLMESLKISYKGSTPVIVKADPINLDASDLESENHSSILSEGDFLERHFSDQLDIQELNLDNSISEILQNRIDEVSVYPRDKSSLGTIFLLGSTLEGILLGVGLKNLNLFMTSKSAPKDRSLTPKKIYDWKLSELIDVAFDLGLIKLDVKKFSHALRDFRNYIHPYQQLAENFSPSQHTVDVSWQVFKAAFYQLKESQT